MTLAMNGFAACACACATCTRGSSLEDPDLSAIRAASTLSTPVTVTLSAGYTKYSLLAGYATQDLYHTIYFLTPFSTPHRTHRHLYDIVV